MAQPVVVTLDKAMLRFPKAVNRRLHDLLDRQDQGQSLSMKERLEAEGLVELAELISLLKMRAVPAGRKAKLNGRTGTGNQKLLKKTASHS